MGLANCVLYGVAISRGFLSCDPIPPSTLVSDMGYRWVQAGDGNVSGCILPISIVGSHVSARSHGEGPLLALC
jgi:hypothetical protein